jgi:hypothetical protein
MKIFDIVWDFGCRLQDENIILWFATVVSLILSGVFLLIGSTTLIKNIIAKPLAIQLNLCYIKNGELDCVDASIFIVMLIYISLILGLTGIKFIKFLQEKLDEKSKLNELKQS